MQQTIIIFLYIMFPLCCGAQGISKTTISALEKLQAGQLDEAAKELKTSYGCNDVAAQYFIGICYEQGLFVDKNIKEAFFIFRKTAERGLPDAMYKLSLCYKHGYGVTADYHKSKEWITRYESKGGKCVLPDFVQIYNQGVIAANKTNPQVKQEAQKVIAQETAARKPTLGTHDLPPIQNVHTQKQEPEKVLSEVDIDIPSIPHNNENTFAVIISNENYQDLANVPNALNDGKIFAEYCFKTLGIPKQNLHHIKDATLNNIKREVNWLKRVADAYSWKAKVIIYYAGHGIPDEKTKDSYLLPVDGFCGDISTAYSLKEFYKTLSTLPSTQIIAFIDACFSGSTREAKMLVSSRGVAIKAKPATAEGNLVVFSAAQNDESAYSYEEQSHGLFTYYLLKKIKETDGDVSLYELAIYIKDQVSKKAIVINGKPQTPSIMPSPSIGENWKEWKLK